MQRVSNNITILLKLFIPTFWFVFFSSFLIALFLVDPTSMPLLTSRNFKLGYITIYILFGLFLYFTFMRLNRVDMGPEKFHVSNYFKTYSYQYSDIEEIEEMGFIIFRIINIKLKGKGSLGRNILFIPSYKNYEHFVANHPKLFSHLN